MPCFVLFKIKGLYVFRKFAPHGRNRNGAYRINCYRSKNRSTVVLNNCWSCFRRFLFETDHS